MSCMNADTRDFWQDIATRLSRQRPDPGKKVTVIHGKRYRGERAEVVQRIKDKYEDAFRYGGEANHHMREMAGRYGFVCRVRLASSGQLVWIKARYLMCDYSYSDCWTALADALQMV